MFEKITSFGENCVSAAPDTLNGTAQQNKEWFDKAVKYVVATAFNNLVLELERLFDGIEEGAQVNKIESVTYNGTQLPVENKNVNIDTYRGMRKMAQTVLSAENTSISLNVPVTRGYALLTWPSEQRDISGKPIGYIIDATGKSLPVTAYQNGIGKYVTGYYMIDFEIFSQVAKVSSYAVFSQDGAESAVVVSDKAINTKGRAQGIKFFFSGKFPAGTTLELWGE